MGKIRCKCTPGLFENELTLLAKFREYRNARGLMAGLCWEHHGSNADTVRSLYYWPSHRSHNDRRFTVCEHSGAMANIDINRTYLYGGTYISGQIDLSILAWFLRTDLTARAINNLWNSYQAYVSFTRLGDPPYGNSTPACDAHLAGPQSTKFCGVGGVFYLYMLSEGDQDNGAWSPNGGDLISAYPGQIMPYGLNKFETDAMLNLTASVSPTHVPSLQGVQLR